MMLGLWLRSGTTRLVRFTFSARMNFLWVDVVADTANESVLYFIGSIVHLTGGSKTGISLTGTCAVSAGIAW